MILALNLPWRWGDPHATHPGIAPKWPMRLLTGLLVVGLMATILLSVRAFQEAAYQQYWDGRVAASYTGWVATSPPAALAITIEPCRHAPCQNIALDFSYRATPQQDIYTKIHYFTLGGEQTGPHSLYVVGSCLGVICTATITQATWQGDITDGSAVMTFK